MGLVKDAAVRAGLPAPTLIHPEAVFPEEGPWGSADGSVPWCLKRGFPK